MSEKKHVQYPSPDLSKMQEVVIDSKTKIYILKTANAEEAKVAYISRASAAKKN